VDDLEAHLKALMLRGLDGDARAHRDLLVALGARLRAYLGQRMSDCPADVEDLVQDCLLSVHTRRSSYDRDQPLTSWAHAIARYKLIDYWRRRKVRFAKPLDDVSEFLAAPMPQLDDGLDLTRAIRSLPARQRELVEEVKIKGLSLAEAGEQAGTSEGAAKVAMHRAMKALATRMGRADR
jgi:RNA polymerase sigma-70 factor (ECF subfamily)